MRINMAAKHNNNVVKFRKKPKAAAIIFIIVLIYIISFAWLYSTKKKVQTYVVNTGSLTANTVFSGIAVRQESVINSSYNGNVNYYLREGTKAKVGDTIYTVDETGRVAQLISDAANSDTNSLSEENLKIIKSTLNSFKTSYTGDNFSTVYDLKADLNSTVLQSINENIMANLDSIISSTGSQNLFQTIRTEQSGVVVYSIDGYETLTESSLSPDSFNKGKYNKTNLKSQDIIVSGNPAYKIITNENWSIYIQLTQSDIDKYDLTNKNSLQIRFVKDDIVTTAPFTIVRNGDNIWGRFTLDKYMIRYASDRFIDIEIQASTSTGLKIPLSSIVEKDFYTIPKSYMTTGGNTSTYGFLCEHYENNELVTEFIAADIYAVKDDMCYVDMTSFGAGDTILLTNSTERYPIGTKASLKGVYCANTGYTIFKPVEVIEQNSEYCIVRKGTSYGIAVYDHIILEGSNIGENEMIY
ncbi:MAG: HlyD family efflux transporter periplasmic adaptor subunit [Clostridia bacterium]|nr:HlyD family efflux transporter periplasmic adaptor subunit [Clostridia bacterium]